MNTHTTNAFSTEELRAFATGQPYWGLLSSVARTLGTSRWTIEMARRQPSRFPKEYLALRAAMTERDAAVKSSALKARILELTREIRPTVACNTRPHMKRIVKRIVRAQAKSDKWQRRMEWLEIVIASHKAAQ